MFISWCATRWGREGGLTTSKSGWKFFYLILTLKYLNRKPTQKSSTAPNKKYWTQVFVYFNHLEWSKWLEVMKTNQHLIYKNYKIVLLNWDVDFVCFSFIRIQKQCFYLKVWSLKFFWNLIDFGFKKMMKKI